MVKQPCSNFRVITANFSGVSIFRIFTVFQHFILFSILNTVKPQKIWKPQKYAVIILKFKQGCFTRVMRPKDADGMANSVLVDLDQTAKEQSDLGLHCLLSIHVISPDTS